MFKILKLEFGQYFAADVDAVGNSLLQICKLRFGHKAKLLFRFDQEIEVGVPSRF